ncbi:conserved hypothetical protein [Gloeothece citriformis PCC 7424]|uniref:Uncharacterized protein n=1 Tax=Gloeothece citriformis (strain PCC 7424) TaxID=65393 RepID=B7KBC5_GLOC7|nr:hypothetical protein [Gloeothece citriformis]ACK71481.1 conserved hypothetical protein [Gloeothece citriformis PCC 7424]
MKHLISVTLLATLGLSFPITLVAQDPPARTYQPGFWQPVARVDLNRPMKIQLVNQTNIPLEYDFTNTFEVPPQPLKPQETVTIKEQLPIPAYLLINPSSFLETPASGANPDLTFNVAVNDDNVVRVTIITAGENDKGHSTFNLHETGAIYVY